MPFVIVNNNMKQPPYWQTPCLYKDPVTGAWRQAGGLPFKYFDDTLKKTVTIGGWEKHQKYATLYASQDEAEKVILIRCLDASVKEVQ
jgi:hypothetical protein